MLIRPQLQAGGGGEPTGGYLVWVDAGLLAVEGGSSKLVVEVAPRLPPLRLATWRLVPTTVAALASILAVAAAASVATLVVGAAGGGGAAPLAGHGGGGQGGLRSGGGGKLAAILPLDGFGCSGEVPRGGGLIVGQLGPHLLRQPAQEHSQQQL